MEIIMHIYIRKSTAKPFQGPKLIKVKTLTSTLFFSEASSLSVFLKAFRTISDFAVFWE